MGRMADDTGSEPGSKALIYLALFLTLAAAGDHVILARSLYGKTLQLAAKMQQRFEEQYQGATNAGKPIWLGPDARVEILSQSPKEMEFPESRKLTRDEVVSALEVPGPVVGILDKANYANMKEARESWWLDTLVPRLEMIRADLQIQLIDADFGTDYRLAYDLSRIPALWGLQAERFNQAASLRTMGWSLNEINDALHLNLSSPKVGGDLNLVPAGLVPADSAGSLTGGGIY
jgi:phage portal protein BeeE